MNNLKSEGVILKRYNFGEADKIITVFSKHFGKMSLLAKGVRKLTSRKRSSLEIFNQIKFFAVGGKGMDIITEVETINSFSVLRKDLKKIAVAYELVEMVDKLMAEGSEQEEIYYLLAGYLEKIQDSQVENLFENLDSYARQLIKILGYWPKDKDFPGNFNTCLYIEEIAEKEIKSRKFLNRI